MPLSYTLRVASFIYLCFKLLNGLSGSLFGGKVIDNSDSLKGLGLVKDTCYEVEDLFSACSLLSCKVRGCVWACLRHVLIGFFLFLGL